MDAVAPLTDVLERVYAPEPDTPAWLLGIRDAVTKAFAGHLAALVYTARLEENAIVVERVAPDARCRAVLVDTHRRAGALEIAAYRSGGLLRASTLHRLVPHRRPRNLACAAAAVPDLLSCIGVAERSRVCIVSFVLAERQRISRTSRVALSRLSAHLGAAYRLRARPSDLDEAVLAPAGAPLAAMAEADEQRGRERLRGAAIRMVRAEREAPSDPAASRAFWTAMVDGRWTLVERIDADGKRLVLAKRNAPESIARRALTERQRVVVERAARGDLVRHIADELGVAESTVSEELSLALKKLGLRARAELIELRASLG